MEKLGLAWQTMLTHAAGFIIFFLIMKKFAWKPLLNLLEERRQKIANSFKDIDEKNAEANTLKGKYEDKLKNIEAERRQKIAEAVNEANKMASDIKIAAQEEARSIVNKTSEQLERDVAKAKIQLKEDMVSITLAAAEKILHEKLDEKKDRELIGRFIESVEKA